MSRGATARLEAWFRARGWRAFDFQREAWRAYAAGESGLIHAATGTGKSLAVWGGPLIEALSGMQSGEAPPLRVLWITPLRALAADTLETLRAPAVDLGLSWAVEARTGDTPQSVRSRQRRRLPTALVTTPESLSLLLSYADHPRLFSGLRTVVVDEWHELIGSRRGVQLELCLARLRRMRPGLSTWGLSATLGNLEEARDTLLGPGASGRLIRGDVPGRTRIEAVIPDTLARFPWAGHLGLKLLPQALGALEAARSTLLFTNTRAQAELWYQAIRDARPDWANTIALHHGSLDRCLRDAAEAGLKSGAVRCVVATSSLDLGVDFSPVDQVIQVGSPKGVARLLQRAGRSGHQPGAESRVLCVPTHAFELVEIAAARRAAEAGTLEARHPLADCLDVLAQHAVTVALGAGFEPDDLFEEARTTRAFRDLDRRRWCWVLDFITRGGDALQAYPHFHRVVERDGRLIVSDATIARRHRMAVGTITSDATMQVRWVKGGRIGTVEEAFISRLRPGERFLFAGRLLELARVRDMTAYVRRARGAATSVPRWMGGRLPLSGTLAGAMRTLLDPATPDLADEPEMKAVRGLLDAQAWASHLPASDELLVERIRSREGVHLYVYPFAGRLANEGLGSLIAYRLSRLKPATFTVSANDYGFELLSADPPTMGADELPDLFSGHGLIDDLLACMNTGEMARRQFRDIARVSGLVFQGYPGRGKSARQVQASSGLVFDVLTRFDAGNLLVAQAHREVLEAQLEASRLGDTLAAIGRGRIVFREPRRLTPLAFPLWAERIHGKLSSEDWRARVERMAVRLEAAAG